MRKYTVQYGQTMLDIAVQEYGHVDGVFLLIKDNPNYSITDVPVPGEELLIRDEAPQLSEDNRRIAAEYKEQGITVASGMAASYSLGMYVTVGFWKNGYTLPTMKNLPAWNYVLHGYLSPKYLTP
jgi:hypothetical protein